jgi:hypothetical protein
MEKHKAVTFCRNRKAACYQVVLARTCQARKRLIYARAAIRVACKADGIVDVCCEVEIDTFNPTCVVRPLVFDVANQDCPVSSVHKLK